MSRQLVAVVDVYEITPLGGYKLLHENIRVEPQTVSCCEEDELMVDKHYFNLCVSTYEGRRVRP